MRRPQVIGRLATGAVLIGALAAAAAGQVGPIEDLESLLGAAGADGNETPAAATDPPPPPTPLGVGENTGFEAVAADRFEFHARNLDVAEAFAQLRQLVRRNIVVAPRVNARFTGDLYDLPYEQIVDVICRSTGLVAREEGAFIFVDQADLETRIWSLDHARADDLAILVAPMLSPEGFVSGTLPAKQGIVSSQEEAGGDDYARADVLVARDYGGILDDIDAIVRTVDGRPDQVLVEATILTARLTDNFEFGVQFTALSGADFVDVAGVSPDGTSVAVGPYPSGVIDDGVSTFNSRVASDVSTGGLNVGFLKDGVGVFLRALKQITETQVLATPRIITVNKQRGEVLLGRRDGYRTLTVTQTSTTEEVEFLETGTRLVFRPYILADDHVRMEVHPEDSDGGINLEGLPFKETTEITTNVVVRNGETVVIGGLFRERVKVIRTRVPWLGRLPLIGWLFRSETEEVVREEIIILLTPHILRAASHETARMDVDAHGVPELVRSSVDVRRLADVYLAAARRLVATHDHGSAAAMLDACRSLGSAHADLDALAHDVWDAYLPAPDAEAVDRLIREQLREHPAEEGTP